MGHNAIFTPESAIALLEITAPICGAVPLVGSILEGSIGVVLAVLRKVQEVKSKKEKCQDLAYYALRITATIVAELMNAEPDMLERQKVHVQGLLSTLQSVQALVDKLTRGSALKFMTGWRAKADITKLQQQLQTALDSFSIKTLMGIERIIMSLEHKVNSAQKRESSVFLKDTLHPVLNAGFLSRHDRAGCLPNTRTVLLHEIEEWALDSRPSVPRVYWLSGLGGTGKSTIVHTICESLHKNQRLGASFFFSRDEGDRRKPELILPTLSYQLALFNKLYHRQVSITLEEQPDIPEHAQRYQFDELLKYPLQKLSDRLPPFVIVLDAIDECDKYGADVLPLLLQGISKLPANIKILISSRPENAIQDMFRSAGPGTDVYYPYALHNMAEKMAHADIKLYLVHHLQRIQQEQSVPPPWPTEVDLDTLVSRAGAFFTFASTIVHFIADRLYSPDDQLRRFLQQDPSYTQSTFARVDSLYTYILKTFVQDRTDTGAMQDRHDADILCERFRIVVGAIVSLQDPVSISTLSKLVQRSEGDTRAALHPLRSVLDVPDGDSMAPIRIFHPSFREFLISHQRCQDRRFFIQEAPTHARIALRCFVIMQEQLVRNVCKIESKYVLNNEVPDLSQRLEKYVSSELSYACRYWSIHLSKAGTASSYDLFQSLLRFCSEKLLYWIEVLSLQGKISMCIENVVTSLSWCKANSIEGEVINMLTDAQRLVMDFHKAFRESAMQVYNSALIFMPNCSLLHHYNHELPSAVTMITPRSDDWEACLLVLEGHTGAVRTTAIFPDGNRLASGSEDSTIRIWNSFDGSIIACLEGHTMTVTSVDVSPDGAYMVSGSEDKTIRLWITSTLAEIYVVYEHTAAIRSVAFSSDGLHFASASDDKTARIWNVASGAQVQVLEGHSQGVQSVSYSEDGLLVVTGGLDGTTKIWNPETGGCLKTLDNQGVAVLSVSCAPDNRRVAVGSHDNTVGVWDGTTGLQSMVLRGHSSPVDSAEFSRNAARILSGSRDGAAIVWNAYTGSLIAEFRGHTGFVSCARFSPNGGTILSASQDRTVRIWDATLTSVRGSRNWVTILAISSDCAHVVSGSTDGKIALWETARGHIIYEIAPYQGAIYSLAIAPRDNSSILSIGEKSLDVDLWNLADGSRKGRLKGHTAPISSSTFSFDGKQIVSTSEDCTIRVWNVATTTCIVSLSAGSKCVCSTFSPSGDRVVSGTEKHTITVWDLRSQKEIIITPEYDSPVLWAMFSPNGKWITVWYEDEAVRVFDTHKYVLVPHREWRLDRLALSRSIPQEAPVVSYEQLVPADEDVYLQEDGWLTIPKIARRICWVPPSRRPPWMRSLWQGRNHVFVIGSQSGQITMIKLQDDCWTVPSDTSLH